MFHPISKGAHRGLVVPRSLLQSIARETLPFLSPVRVSQVLGYFGTSDLQTSNGQLWFLTNGLSEDTGNWHPDVLRYYGESYQEQYPLTLPEAQFIEPGGILLPDYPTDVCLGYSVWWRDRKWICPTLEYCYIPNDPESQLHGLERENPGVWTCPDPLRAFVEKEAERLAPLLRAVHGEVLLDLISAPDRYVLHLLVPFEHVSTHFGAREAWQHFLQSLFPATPPLKLVFLNTNCEQERGGLPELSNAVGKSYGASVYDLTEAPSFLSEDTDGGELLDDWLRTQECYLKAWGPGEAAAIHNARLACEEENLIPVNPVTRRYFPRDHHCNPFA